MSGPLVSYTSPEPSGWVNKNPATGVSPTELDASAIQTIDNGLASAVAAINYLASLVGGGGGGSTVTFTDNGDGSITVTSDAATAAVSKPVSDAAVLAYLDARYERLLSGTTGLAHLKAQLAALGVMATVREASPGVVPNRPNYAGPVEFLTAGTPDVRTDGVTTGGTPQMLDGRDWVRQL